MPFFIKLKCFYLSEHSATDLTIITSALPVGVVASDRNVRENRPCVKEPKARKNFYLLCKNRPMKLILNSNIVLDVREISLTMGARGLINWAKFPRPFHRW